MTYARARLWTGILGVGSFVLLALALLFTGWRPVADGGFGTIWFVLASVAVMALPFDFIGGYLLPHRFGRQAPSRAEFVLDWARGVLVLVTISAASGSLLLLAASAGGWLAAIGAFVGVSALLILLQRPIAQLVGGLPRLERSDGLIVVDAKDPAFSGGFDGPSGNLIVPRAWRDRFGPRLFQRLVERRRRILNSGARTWSVLFALGWNTLGFTLASLLPGAGFANLGELIGTALGFTLWTFLGLLLLPTPSRRATFAMDALAAESEQEREELSEAIAILDKLQDDEPERGAGVETIFHPIPSVKRRVSALRQKLGAVQRTWNLARTSLYMAHAGLTPLPRAVHCNVGRPELWVYLPTDG